MEDRAARYHIRKLWPFHASAFRRHLLRLDGETRRARFGTSVSNKFLDGYADTARRTGTVIFGAFVGSEMVASGELRSLHILGDNTAEAAFAVERSHQQQGLGSALMERLIIAARNRGIGQLHMICTRDNDRMQRLAGKFGALIRSDEGEVLAQIQTEPMTALSLLDEARQDATGFVTAVLDWRQEMAA